MSRRARHPGCLALAALLLGLLLWPLARQARLRSHPALVRGVDFLLECDEIRTRIGTSGAPRGWIRAELRERLNRGDADIELTLAGPRGSARVRLQLIKDLGQWGVEGAGIVEADGTVTDLSPEETDFGAAPDAGEGEKVPA
jgi:hypothetical protein